MAAASGQLFERDGAVAHEAGQRGVNRDDEGAGQTDDQRMGRHHQALAYADRAIALDPKLVEAYLHKATAARALGKTEVIQEVCQVLATLAPEHFCRAR